MSARTLSCGAVLVAALCLAPAPARADLTDGWYGYQIMLSDLGSLAFVGIGAQQEGSALTLVGAGAFVAVPPLIHLAHGRGKGALLSLGMRAIPAIGVLRVLADDDTPIQSGVLWLGLGLAGVIVDWTFNAVEDDPPATTPRVYGLSFGGSF